MSRKFNYKTFKLLIFIWTSKSVFWISERFCLLVLWACSLKSFWCRLLTDKMHIHVCKIQLYKGIISFQYLLLSLRLWCDPEFWKMLLSIGPITFFCGTDMSILIHWGLSEKVLFPGVMNTDRSNMELTVFGGGEGTTGLLVPLNSSKINNISAYHFSPILIRPFQPTSINNKSAYHFPPILIRRFQPTSIYNIRIHN